MVVAYIFFYVFALFAEEAKPKNKNSYFNDNLCGVGTDGRFS